MFRLAFAVALSLLLALPSYANDLGSQADHDKLRKLKADITAAVNARDYAAMQALLHQPFMATLVTQDNFTDLGKLKEYFEGLYSRDWLRMKSLSISADADDLSQIYQGTFSINKGTTNEHYELADGRQFDMQGRWTAVSIKENGEWKLLAVHSGTNFLDNPVLGAIEKSVIWFGLGGAAGGLIIGFVAGWWFRRGRVGKAAG
jgi:ketosteroid isomerase-like protein